MCLAVKLICVVKRVKRIIGTGMCEVTEFIKMFLPFTHIPVKAFCQGIKPVRDLVLCTYWRHWIDRCCHTKAVNRKTLFLSLYRSSVSFIYNLTPPLTLNNQYFLLIHLQLHFSQYLLLALLYVTLGYPATHLHIHIVSRVTIHLQFYSVFYYLKHSFILCSPSPCVTRGLTALETESSKNGFLFQYKYHQHTNNSLLFFL